MELANAAAHRRKHEYIGTEHLLLGLIDEDSGVAVHVLRKLGIDPNELAARVTQVLLAGPDINTKWMGERPHTPRAKNVVELAIQSSKELGHDHVGTEHILLGLIKEKDGVAGEVLREHITPEDVCAVLQSDKPLPTEDLAISKKPFPCGLASLFGLTAVLAFVVWLVPPFTLFMSVVVVVETILAVGLAVGLLAFRDWLRARASILRKL